VLPALHRRQHHPTDTIVTRCRCRPHSHSHCHSHHQNHHHHPFRLPLLCYYTCTITIIISRHLLNHHPPPLPLLLPHGSHFAHSLLHLPLTRFTQPSTPLRQARSSGISHPLSFIASPPCALLVLLLSSRAPPFPPLSKWRACHVVHAYDSTRYCPTVLLGLYLHSAYSLFDISNTDFIESELEARSCQGQGHARAGRLRLRLRWGIIHVVLMASQDEQWRHGVRRTQESLRMLGEA